MLKYGLLSSVDIPFENTYATFWLLTTLSSEVANLLIKM